MDRVPGFEPGGWRFEPSSVHLFSMMHKEYVILIRQGEAVFFTGEPTGETSSKVDGYFKVN